MKNKSAHLQAGVKSGRENQKGIVFVIFLNTICEAVHYLNADGKENKIAAQTLRNPGDKIINTFSLKNNRRDKIVLGKRLTPKRKNKN